MAKDWEWSGPLSPRQFSSLGIESFAVNDGFAALAELERTSQLGRSYDAAILDEMMPGMAGHTLAERIRAIPAVAKMTLVLASSIGHPDSGSEALDVILTKP